MTILYVLVNMLLNMIIRNHATNQLNEGLLANGY
ncbi:hypothetical protein CLW00_11411 [Mongoliibacter ruber]|uniref:Uncharacterized protein n=1 Tax=Mongoliibacter ruber TaxID=1750599 RepID=A0A2T0WF00_9BACT|nr:hypothetical protein CLW00_11411 [Mongoliibacter ruber]